MKKRISLVLALIMIVTVFAGCGHTSPAATATAAASGSAAASTDAAAVAPSKVFKLACSENMTTLDPHNNVQMLGKIANALNYEAPLYYDEATGEFVPYLCESYDISKDGLTWTFKIRKGIKFQNGEDMNADDWVCTFQRLKDRFDNSCIAQSYWTDLDSFGKTDDYTFWLKTKEPNATMRVGLYKTYIIPNEAYAKEGEDMFVDGKCWGTGPWVFDKWIDGQYIHFFKNKDYWNKKWFDSYYDEFYMYFMSEPSSAIASHLSGDINAYIASGGISNDMLPLYKGTENKIEQISFNSGNYLYLGLSYKDGSPFLDKNVRKALDLCIDRQSIVKDVIGDGMVPQTIITTNEFGYDPNIEPCVYDPDTAKKCLAESKYDGREIKLYSNNATLKAEEILLAISENMNAVGFKTSVEVVEVANLASIRKKGDYDVFMVANMNGCGEAGTDLNWRIVQDAHHSFYEKNGGAPGKELVKLVKAQLHEMDAEKRKTIFHDIQRSLRDNYGPHLVIAQLVEKEAVDLGVTGLELLKDGTFRFTFVTYDPNSKHCVAPDFKGFGET